MADPAATSIVIPAYNEGRAIGSVVSSLAAAAPWREILVIDDGSSDDTGRRAADAGARVIRHPYNKGNGAAVKTGLRAAAGEFVVVLDADGQHAAADALAVQGRLDEFDLVVGARATASHASVVRRLGNRLLSGLASLVSGHPIPDLTSGLRAARLARLKEFMHLLPNGFSTPATTTLAFLRAGYNVTFVPIEAAPRVGDSKIRLGRDGGAFVLILLRVVTVFSPLRIFAPVSLVALVTGGGYALWTIVTQSHVTNTSVLLIVLGVFVLLIGLVSEQIAMLRFERHE